MITQLRPIKRKKPKRIIVRRTQLLQGIGDFGRSPFQCELFLSVDGEEPQSLAAGRRYVEMGPVATQNHTKVRYCKYL